MLDPFDQKKALILLEIAGNSEDSPDASPKGTIDELCIPMMELLNSHLDIVTTSSCSGRVSVFLEGDKGTSESVKIGAKGAGGHWLFVSHDSSKIENWWVDKELKFKEIPYDKITDQTRYLLYKFEPFILHVKCRNLEVANRVYTCAMGCGFRESGIGSNNIVAVRISIKLDIPIGFLDEDSNEFVAVVSEDYLKLLTKLSLDRFKENLRKIDQLHSAFEKMISLPVVVKAQEETKEERKLRKMLEGMARRDGVRKQKELAKLLKLQQLNIES